MPQESTKENMNSLTAKDAEVDAATEQKIRAALNLHWNASARGDLQAEHDIYQDDAICDYPQSGEQIHGRGNLQALRTNHPAKPSGFTVVALRGCGHLWVTEYIIRYTTGPLHVVSIMEFQGEKVAHETQYFAEPFEAPAWRARWVELKPR
jgi:hypothetical protein